jgi:hypothetical protein
VLRHEFEADCCIRSFDNFKVEVRRPLAQHGGEVLALIGVGDEFLQAGKQPEQRRHDGNAAVAILDVGWMTNSMEQEA